MVRRSKPILLSALTELGPRPERRSHLPLIRVMPGYVAFRRPISRDSINTHRHSVPPIYSSDAGKSRAQTVRFETFMPPAFQKKFLHAR
jgi:hypothetical protein